jgi:hypothetical protein
MAKKKQWTHNIKGSHYYPPNGLALPEYDKLMDMVTKLNKDKPESVDVSICMTGIGHATVCIPTNIILDILNRDIEYLEQLIENGSCIFDDDTKKQFDYILERLNIKELTIKHAKNKTSYHYICGITETGKEVT